MKIVLTFLATLMLSGCGVMTVEMTGFHPDFTARVMRGLTAMNEGRCSSGIASETRQAVARTVYYGDPVTTRPISREEATAQSVVYCKPQ